MEFVKKSIAPLFLVLLLAGFSASAHAQSSQSTQSRRDAVQAYNKARKLAQNNKYSQAVNEFEQAKTIAQKLGDKGNDIVKLVNKRLPQMYFEQAVQAYKAAQQDNSLSSLDKAIDAFKTSEQMAKKYGDQQLQQKSDGIVTQLMYHKSVAQYKQKNYDASLTTVNNIIKRNPNYAKAYYHKGLILRKQKNNKLDSILAVFDKAIAVAKKTNDTQIAQDANNAAGAELVYRGSEAIKNKHYNEAISLLNHALKYNSDSSDAFYRLAQAYNKKSDWNKARDDAEKALKNSHGGKTSNAKIYYELGNAYQGMGKKSEACNAFSNADYGEFKSSTDHIMKYELKCKGTQ